MKTVDQGHSRQVRCVACETNVQPLYVPWEQHAIGCPVRSELQCHLPAPLPVRAPMTRAA